MESVDSKALALMGARIRLAQCDAERRALTSVFGSLRAPALTQAARLVAVPYFDKRIE